VVDKVTNEVVTARNVGDAIDAMEDQKIQRASIGSALENDS